MKPFKNNTIFYNFKCDSALLSFRLKTSGRILNLMGATKYCEIPVSYINNYSLTSSGPYYIIDLKVNSYKFSKSDNKFRQTRIFLLKAAFDHEKLNGLIDLLDKQTSFDLWHHSFYDKLNAAEA